MALLVLALALLSVELRALVPLGRRLEDVWGAEDLSVADALCCFLEAFSCCALPELFLEAVLSAFDVNPPMLLLRFCSLAGACVFWSRAVIWLLLSAGSPLLLSCGGALQYTSSMSVFPSWSLPMPSMLARGALLPK